MSCFKEATANRIIQEKNGADVQGVNIEITRSEFSVWCQATEGKPIVDTPGQANSGYGPATTTADGSAGPYGLQQNPKWWTFCDAKCAGMKDPKLFSKEILQE